MSYRYSLVSEMILYDGGSRRGYGIAVECDGQVIDTLRDLSGDRDGIARLVDRFNRLGLSYTHLYECIEDALG